MVAAGYGSEAAAGRKLFVYGPEAMTMPEIVARYCRVFHPEVETIQVMPIAAARAMAKSTGNAMLGFFADMMAYFEQVGEPGDPAEANALLGAPATTLDQWIARQANAS